MHVRGPTQGIPPMTKARDFKRVVRARATRTGESYTAARASLLAQASRRIVEAPPTLPAATLAAPPAMPNVAPEDQKPCHK